jgi:hypothetical protein
MARRGDGIYQRESTDERDWTMTDDILVGCTEAGCDGVVRLTKSQHDGVDDALIGLACSRGHRFDFEKYRCPRCGSRVTPAEWRPLQAWTGTPPPSRQPTFHPAVCTSCDWEGPK